MSEGSLIRNNEIERQIDEERKIEQKPGKKPRIYQLEMVRAIAFIATIFRHSLAAFIYDRNMDLFAAGATCLLLTLARFGTPTFIFVTGFVLVYNYENTKYDTFLKKRFTKVILPYVLWSGVYFVFIRLASMDRSFHLIPDLKAYGSQLLHGNASYHLWFIIMILQFYILFPAFRWLILKCRGGKRWIGLLTGTVIYQVLAMWIYAKFLPGLAQAAPEGTLLKELLLYRDRSFLLWILYFMMGGIFAANYEEIKGLIQKSKKWIVTGAGLSLAYIVGYSMVLADYNNGMVKVNYLLTSPVYLRMVAYSVLMIFTLFLICTKVMERNGKLFPALRWLGKMSFGGYLVHAIYVNLSARVVNHFFGEQHILICVFLTILSTFICSVITTQIISQFKISKYVIGS